MREESSTRREMRFTTFRTLYIRIPVQGVNLLDMPAPVGDDMQELYVPARHTRPLRFSGHRTGKRGNRKGGIEA